MKDETNQNNLEIEPAKLLTNKIENLKYWAILSPTVAILILIIVGSIENHFLPEKKVHYLTKEDVTLAVEEGLKKLPSQTPPTAEDVARALLHLEQDGPLRPGQKPLTLADVIAEAMEKSVQDGLKKLPSQTPTIEELKRAVSDLMPDIPSVSVYAEAVIALSKKESSEMAAVDWSNLAKGIPVGDRILFLGEDDEGLPRLQFEPAPKKGP